MMGEKGDAMKVLDSLLFISLAHAEIWTKPPYRPDENHLPNSTVQKEEERKRPSQTDRIRKVGNRKLHKEKKGNVPHKAEGLKE